MPTRPIVLILLIFLTACSKRNSSPTSADRDLAKNIDRLVDIVLTSDKDAETEKALSEAKAIFEREGIPAVHRVGDSASYGFVLIHMLAQAPDFRTKFIAKVRESALRHELPEDAVLFAEARLRQTEMTERFRNESPANPALREQLLRLYEKDQGVRRKEKFDAKRMEKTDSMLAGPLKTVFTRYGVPTYQMVGIEAANAFAVMVQHQSAEFRQAVLPKLKSNVDAGQADGGTYAMMYDRSQRDQGKKQLYGEQLECKQGRELSEAPIEDEANVNRRRAELALMRVDLYARLVRLNSPDICGATAQ